jgi:hypothetical protein
MALVTACFAAPAAAQPAQTPPEVAPPTPRITTERDEGLLLRAGGDVTVPAGETAGAVVVIGGDAHIAGRIDSLVVIGGNAFLDSARAREVTVVGGTATLRGATIVEQQVHLVGSEMTREETVTILGAVRSEPMPRWGFFPFGFLFALGLSLATLLAAVIMVSVAPVATERTLETLRREPGRVALAGLALWFLVPALAIMAILSIVGIPAGVGVLMFLLPAMAFLGYLMAGIYLGVRLVDAARWDAAGTRPWLRALVGVAVLMLIGIIPVVGPLVGLVATFLGGGAMALVAWRTWRRRRGAGPRVEAPAARPTPPLPTAPPAAV